MPSPQIDSPAPNETTGCSGAPPTRERPGGAGPTHYLAALDLRGRRCVVAGGGAVARRKVESLVAAGADVLVVAPSAPDLPAGVNHLQRRATPNDLEGAALVFCATDDPATNASLAAEARRRGVFVNVVDDPAAGDLAVPAVLRRGSLQVGVFTGGASPALARRLREQLECAIGEEYAELIELLAELRAEWEPLAKAVGLSSAARGATWHAVLDLPLLELLASRRCDEARARALDVLGAALSDRATG